jgi:predicted CopG family antitoxin
MSPNVTLSFPDDLYEKIEKWKDSLNLSEVFRIAISKEIKRKEVFQKRLKGVSSREKPNEPPRRKPSRGIEW